MEMCIKWNIAKLLSVPYSKIRLSISLGKAYIGTCRGLINDGLLVISKT